MIRSGEKTFAKRLIPIIFIIILIALLCVILLRSTRRAEEGTVRILLSVEKTERMELAVYGSFLCQSTHVSSGNVSLVLSDGILSLENSEHQVIASGPSLILSSSDSKSFVKISNTQYGLCRYSGSLTFSADSLGFIRSTVEIPQDEYVRDVVLFVGRDLPKEAADALEDTVRAYATHCRDSSATFDTDDMIYPYAGVFSSDPSD